VPVGRYPEGVAVNPTGTNVYVTNAVSSTVSVIDTATNKVTATVTVGEFPSGIAVNPTGTKVYVAEYNDKTVSVIDTATNTIKATVPIGCGPYGVAVSPNGKKVYVATLNDISVIDTATNTVTDRVSVGTSPRGIAVTPDGTKVYVVNGYDGTVSVIDTGTNTVTATVPVGGWSEGVAVSPNGKKVYVANYWDGIVSVIDTATNKVTGTVKGGNYPYGIAVTPDGKKVYVVNNDDQGTVSVIDTATNTVTTTVPVGRYPVAFGQFIGSLSLAPFANFSAGSTEGKAPLNVAFTDKSTGTPTKWKWTFGDGTTSTKQNPTHKYSKAGKYTVVLTVSNAAGSNTITKTGYIKVITKPVAAFSVSPTSGKVPLTVVFTDKSAGSPTKWKWTFGDGKTSTEQNPTHKYSKAGKYTVTLKVTNALGINTATKSNYITVIGKPTAAFSASPTSGKAPLNVKFTDKSTGTPTKWQWTFGDGKTSSEQNPTHKYSKVGTYKVKLTAINAAGSSTVTKTGYIVVS
jgi:YVTN family beta-propeller protein